MTSLARLFPVGLGLTLSAALTLSCSSEAAIGPADGMATGSHATETHSSPTGVLTTFDVPYGDGPNQTLDVYTSSLSAGAPSVLLIHGGGWMGGTSRDLASEAFYFARNGFTVFSINYTLSSDGHPSWPQVFDDVQAATDWVSTHAHRYGGDESRMAAVGSSAGAHLAALLDTAEPADGQHIMAAVSWSGPMDLPVSYRDGNDYVHLAIEQLLGCVPGSCDGADLAASPITHVTGDDGPLLFFNSDHELVPISDNRAMRRALKAAAVPSRLVVFKDSSAHANEYECYQARVLGRTDTVIDDTLRWLGWYLNGRPLTPTGTFCG